ncbi:MAG TPA: hypothetical protein VFP84_30600 [Kofleriaceae bacterium]|nr:hypothetical protein [Kofleriaceae bacterium]
MIWAAAACGGHASSVSGPQPSAAPEATRWVPERPSYLVASPAIAGAQRDLGEALDALAAVTGIDAHELSGVAQGLVGVDILNADALAGIGIDVHASWAVFSDAVDPTFVVHLAAPDKTAAFLDHQRARGLQSQAVTVDQTQIFSAPLIGGVTIQWAIAGDWLWIHLSTPRGGATPDDATAWFRASHGAHGGAWADSWAWAARGGGAAGVTGFFDLHNTVAKLGERAANAAACVQLAPAIGRLGIAVHSDEHQIATRLALELGPSDGAALARHVLAPPSGWPAAAGSAALAVAWNLDLVAVRAYLQPCLAAAGLVRQDALAMLDDSGVRAARGLLASFNPDNLAATAAIALDVTRPDHFNRLLDRLPLRSTLEQPRTFAGHRGFAVDIPFSFSVEYVVEPNLVVGGLGEGMVAPLFAPASTSAGAPPIFALDLAPPKLSRAAWATLIQAIAERLLSGSPGPSAKRAADHLLRWRAAHVAIASEGNELVLTARGER